MATYREELSKLDAYLEENKLYHSALCILVYKCIHWITITMNKRYGYINMMSANKDATKMIDVIQVLYDIIDDVEMEIELDKIKKDKLLELKETIRLIIENVDNPIRSNPNIIYDENEDEEKINPNINCNMLIRLENLVALENYIN